ncbi:hypothetical protein BC834DRAFT_632500 [Gloeopeniophorella convolvens]|nr:hypothetical protein BC834DRAFT_632500 [Gloeopeniophorella convolvens]
MLEIARRRRSRRAEPSPLATVRRSSVERRCGDQHVRDKDAVASCVQGRDPAGCAERGGVGTLEGRDKCARGGARARGAWEARRARPRHATGPPGRTIRGRVAEPQRGCGVGGVRRHGSGLRDGCGYIGEPAPPCRRPACRIRPVRRRHLPPPPQLIHSRATSLLPTNTEREGRGGRRRCGGRRRRGRPEEVPLPLRVMHAPCYPSGSHAVAGALRRQRRRCGSACTQFTAPATTSRRCDRGHRELRARGPLRAVHVVARRRPAIRLCAPVGVVVAPEARVLSGEVECAAVPRRALDGGGAA